MSFEDQDKQHALELEERRVARILAAQQRKDVQAVFGTVEGRRVLSAFLHAAAADVSPLRHDQLTTGHAIGWQDAAGWWLNEIRTHCPEKEVQMRAEARREAAQPVPQDESDDD